MLTRPLATYLVTSFFARLADEGMGVTVALLALARTGDAAQGAVVLTAWTAPHVVAAPLMGAFAARTRRPRACYGGTLAVFAAGVAGVAGTVGRVPLVAVVAVAAVGGCCGPLVTGGMSSMLGGLVDADGRTRAYALDSATYNAATLAGPALGAVLTGAWSAGAATAALAGSAALAALGAAALPIPRLGDSAPPGLATAMVRGGTVIWRNGVLHGVTAGTCVAYLGIGALPVTAVLLAGSWSSARDGGLLMTAFAAGALVAAVGLARWRPTLPPERLAGYCLLGCTVALGLAAASPGLVVGLALFATAGACDGPLLSATLAARSQHAPAGSRPQVFTVGAALKVSAAACGAGLVAVAADLLPALLLLGIAGTQLAGYAALRLLPRLPGSAAAGAHQLDHRGEA
ncbi:MAG: MFS transporter [Streptosporangiales bacterium]|nr:MFS transporter [Streptosporangiales bacterium]